MTSCLSTFTRKSLLRFCHRQIRCHSKGTSLPFPRALVELYHRGLVEVDGDDSFKFIQGLTTNNVEELSMEKPIQYCMLLNVQGRVLYEVLLYRHKEQSCMIECDSSSTDALIKHFKKYMLRSKVTVKDVSDQYTVLATHSSLLEEDKRSDILVGGPDPRLSELGARAIVQKQTKDKPLLNMEAKPLDFYHQHRMLLGVAEGVSELVPEKALPFEFNLDYMNGVSFSKGCYLGQELTARSHHVGVIRKRLLPVTIDDVSDDDAIENGAKCYDESGKSVGKFVTQHGDLGLAILKLSDIQKKIVVATCSSEKKLTIHPTIPNWWPSPQ